MPTPCHRLRGNPLFASGLIGVALLAFLNATPTSALGGANAARGTIHRVEGAVQAPVRVSSTQPVYPEEARKERIEGKVVVRSVIDQEGLVAATEVVDGRSTDREDLRRAALDAVEDWTFEPATLEGEPVSVYYHLTINFRLTKDGEKEAGG